MRNASLRERYFGTVDEAAEREERIRSEIRERWAAARAWLEAPGTKVFETQLDLWLDAHEAKPGTHEEMLFNSGIRAGLFSRIESKTFCFFSLLLEITQISENISGN